MYSTGHKQHSLGEKNDFTLYMFEEDLEMIKRWAEEPSYSGRRPSGGYLFGLWTNTLNPVIHIVFKDESPAEDYLLLKSPQLKKEKALSMFSRIGYWSFERREQCFQDTRFVFLEVEMKYSVRSLAFHPVLLFKGQISRGKIEPLKGKNPFRLPEELTLASQDEYSKEEKSEGVVAFIWKKFESGVTKVAEAISGSMQDWSTMQASTVDQSYQQSANSPASDSKMPQDATTCTKKNQWYLTQNGQKILQELSNKLGEVINENPKISRDEDTHNIMILFSFENKSYVIFFPPNFPKLRAELYHPKQTGNKRCNASSSMLEEKDPSKLVQEVINKLH